MTTPKRPRPARKKLGYLLLVLAVALCTGIVGPRLWTHSRYASKIFTKSNTLPSDAEPRVALVLGAGLWNNSEPSSVLHDRILTAVELYKAGKVQKLLMSGDNRFHHYNEPEVMRKKALEMGVPEQDVICDFAGRRTFDSCWRAKHIFEVRRVVLVTQAFHLDRALYLAESLGLDAVGVVADRQTYPQGHRFWWSVREIPATVGAVIDINILAPKPVAGEKEPILVKLQEPSADSSVNSTNR